MNNPNKEGTASAALDSSRLALVPSRRMKFKAALLRQTPSQLDLAYGDVQATLLALENQARAFGSKLGVRFGPVELDEPKETGDLAKDMRIAMRVLISRIHLFSLDRINGQWGLWYSSIWRGASQSTVPLRDAPIEARMVFLEHSEEFFHRYLEAAEKQLQQPQAAVALGNQTLELLNQIEER